MASDRTLMAKALLSGSSLQRSGSLSTVLRGVGIASIIKTGTSGLIDEYTITYTDGRTQTYEVTNGAEGPRGPKGDKGPRGYPGFSAYQYATMGGYEGTEEEFTQLMASNATMAETVEYYSWTEEIKTALMACFENVAWVNPDGQTYYDALYAALYDRVWSITNTLTGCRNTNTMTAITKGRPYNGILEALGAYTMEGATVSITMGGVDVTAEVYADGTISIPAVTGAVVITAEAVRTAWAITNVLTHCTTDNDTDWVAFGEPYEAALTVAEGYEMESVTITMGGEDVSSYYSSGAISIPAVTGDVVITATAVPWDFEWDYTMGLPNNNGMTLEQTGTATVTIDSTGVHYVLPTTSGYMMRYKYDAIGSVVKSKTIAELKFIINRYSGYASAGLRFYNGLGGTSSTAPNAMEMMFANNGTQSGVVWLAQVSGWSIISSTPLATGVEHTARLIQTNGTCEVWVDGVLLDTVTSFREPVAYPSFTINRDMDVHIKSFKIRTEA